ncbi:MAG: L-2-amino-thiazoline-4-carboxylic acid hydrolase [Saccharofermentans sp.]|nr:L-2-amino-thiazoline-4-carboxylic acid hydrolase [Saccharofermentans sp.]
MKYSGMPMAMGKIYKPYFTKNLVKCFGLSPKESKEIAKAAEAKFKQMIVRLPEFEKNDRFKTNIISCAQLIAFISCMPARPTVEEVTVYYREVMSMPVTKAMCKKQGKIKFSDNDIESQKATAALKAGDRNPYSWTMDFIPYEDGSGYEARFYQCGICTLMKEYGYYDLVPAMCKLDYTMSEMGGASDFVREYTLASGGPYCDCGYKKKNS